jgi:hypothetical protein
MFLFIVFCCCAFYNIYLYWLFLHPAVWLNPLEDLLNANKDDDDIQWHGFHTELENLDDGLKIMNSTDTHEHYIMNLFS